MNRESLVDLLAVETQSVQECITAVNRRFLVMVWFEHSAGKSVSKKISSQRP